MKYTHVMALAIMAATCGSGAANAQSPRYGVQPVGVSPSSNVAAQIDLCSTRVVLRRIAEDQAAAARGVHIPSGYKKVWEDDRLSLRRTEQTLAGKAQMERLWTNAVPRKQRTGPTYPNTSSEVPCAGW